MEAAAWAARSEGVEALKVGESMSSPASQLEGPVPWTVRLPAVLVPSRLVGRRGAVSYCVGKVEKGVHRAWGGRGERWKSRRRLTKARVWYHRTMERGSGQHRRSSALTRPNSPMPTSSK